MVLALTSTWAVRRVWRRSSLARIVIPYTTWVAMATGSSPPAEMVQFAGTLSDITCIISQARCRLTIRGALQAWFTSRSSDCENCLDGRREFTIIIIILSYGVRWAGTAWIQCSLFAQYPEPYQEIKCRPSRLRFNQGSKWQALASSLL